MRQFNLKATGKYLPKTILTSLQMDHDRGYPAGYVASRSGVEYRHLVKDESTAYMAAKAALDALKRTSLQLEDIDCIVSACGVGQQAIPATACLIQKELGLESSGIPAFDINSTCLSFLTALDVCSYMLTNGRYNNILIVASDMPSVALNHDDFESSTIFGDGAAAMIISAAPDAAPTSILSAHMVTYSQGSTYCQIQAGGTQLHPRRASGDLSKYHLFEMNGKAVFRLTSQYIDAFLETLLNKAKLTLDQIDWVVPHQASLLAMQHIQKRLGISPEKLINIFPTHGNQVAASLPTALHEGFVTNKFKKGDRILLIGTSAGLSISGMILEY